MIKSEIRRKGLHWLMRLTESSILTTNCLLTREWLRLSITVYILHAQSCHRYHNLRCLWTICKEQRWGKLQSQLLSTSNFLWIMSSLTNTVVIDRSSTMLPTSTIISTSMPAHMLQCHRATIFLSVQVRTTNSWCTTIINPSVSRQTIVPKNSSHLTVPLELNMSQHSHQYTALIKWSHSRLKT